MHTNAKVSLDNNNLNASFALDGISLGYRLDGRAFGQRRPLSFEFGTKDSSVVVRLGGTVVTACVAARIEPPLHARANEGSIRCIVRDATFLSGRKQSGEQREVLQLYERFLDRSFKESKAVDLESLCIQAGKYVWYVELQLTVMGDDGNLLDALGWAGLAALRVYKREEVEVRLNDREKTLTVHALDVREGVGMTLHHFPVAVTFAVYDRASENEGEGTSSSSILVDPTSLEETTASGSMSISITPQGELCAVQKADGCGMGMSEVFGCLRRGMELAKEGCEVLDAALKKHATDRVAVRVRKYDDGHAETGVMRMEAVRGAIERSEDEMPEEVRRAIKASQAADEDDDDERDGIVDGIVDGMMEDKHTDKVEGSRKSKQQPGRRYTERKGGGKEVYQRASDAVRKTVDGDVQSLQDAFK